MFLFWYCSILDALSEGTYLYERSNTISNTPLLSKQSHSLPSGTTPGSSVYAKVEFHPLANSHDMAAGLGAVLLKRLLEVHYVQRQALAEQALKELQLEVRKFICFVVSTDVFVLLMPNLK